MPKKVTDAAEPESAPATDQVTLAPPPLDSQILAAIAADTAEAHALLDGIEEKPDAESATPPAFFVRNADGEYVPADPAQADGSDIRPKYFVRGADGEYLPVEYILLDPTKTEPDPEPDPEPIVRTDALRFAARLVREDVQMNPSVSGYYAGELRKLANWLDELAGEQEVFEKRLAEHKAIQEEIYAEALEIARAEGDAIHDRVKAGEISLDDGKALFGPIWEAAQRQAVHNYLQRQQAAVEAAAAAEAQAAQEAADLQLKEAARLARLAELEAEKEALLAGGAA